MPPSDPILRSWWPTTQSMDLVEAPLERAAEAVRHEMKRFAKGEHIEVVKRSVDSVQAALDEVTEFDNVCSTILLLPTRSKWTVLWNNNFLCDGYDSLCWCLTSHHGLTTIHWSAHDEWTTFQSGARFTFRRRDGATIVERGVQVAQTDKRWDFFEHGEALAQEDIAGYSVTKKRDRLNERRIVELLGRLGAHPWDAAFYSFPGDAFTISRPVPPAAARRSRLQVLRPPA